MLFVVVAYLKPGMAPKSADLREAFSDHLASNHPRLRLGGPLKDETGARMGSFYIAEAESRQEVVHFVEQSPYARADIYERVEINELTLEAGRLS